MALQQRPRPGALRARCQTCAMRLLARLVITGVAIWLADLLVEGITISQASTTGAQLLTIGIIAIVFMAVNEIVKPIVQFLSLPLYILTLGLFTLVVNALMLMLTAWATQFTQWGMTVDGFWTAVWGALIISVVTWVLGMLVPRRQQQGQRIG